MDDQEIKCPTCHYSHGVLAYCEGKWCTCQCGAEFQFDKEDNITCIKRFCDGQLLEDGQVWCIPMLCEGYMGRCGYTILDMNPTARFGHPAPQKNPKPNADGVCQDYKPSGVPYEEDILVSVGNKPKKDLVKLTKKIESKPEVKSNRFKFLDL